MPKAHRDARLTELRRRRQAAEEAGQLIRVDILDKAIDKALEQRTEVTCGSASD